MNHFIIFIFIFLTNAFLILSIVKKFVFIYPGLICFCILNYLITQLVISHKIDDKNKQDNLKSLGKSSAEEHPIILSARKRLGKIK